MSPIGRNDMHLLPYIRLPYAGAHRYVSLQGRLSRHYRRRPTDKDTRWAKYLYEHLKKRANDDEMVAFGISEKEMWRIIIQIDPTLQNGFKIACKGSDIRLTASDNKQMLWLQYQLIKKISKEDPRIDGSDLPQPLSI